MRRNDSIAFTPTSSRHCLKEAHALAPYKRDASPEGIESLITACFNKSISTMEAAAGIVGLLSFAGQLLNGLVKLNEYIQDQRESDIRTENATRETELMISTITGLRSILQSVKDSNSTSDDTPWASHIVTLHTQLERCGQDLDDWVDNHKPPSGPSSKRQQVSEVLQNRRVRAVRTLESKLVSHRAQISLSIGALNMWVFLFKLDVRILGL